MDPVKDSEAFIKYIGAMGRCGKSERLVLEWEQFSEQTPDWIKNQGAVLEFISAYATANDIPRSLAVVDKVLDISGHDDGDRYRASVSIIQTVFRYDLLPLGLALRHVIDWFLRNKKSVKWSEEDIVEVFNEIGQSRSFSRHEKGVASLIGQELVQTIVQCRNGLDIEASITSFDELLAGTM
jgi:hypothetical protein